MDKLAGPALNAFKQGIKNIFRKGAVEVEKSTKYLKSAIKGESPAIARTPLADSISKGYNQNAKFTQMHYSTVAPIKNKPVAVFNTEQKALALAKEKHLKSLGL